MPEPRESTPAGGVEKTTQARKNNQTRRVLLVDPGRALCPVIEQCQAEHGRVAVVHAPSVRDALKLIETAGRIDLAIVPQADDHAGLELARELKKKDAATASVLLATEPDFALAQQAMRIGATDVIVRPADADASPQWLAETADRVCDALNRQWVERMRSSRIRKLKRLCRKLDEARLEVTEQVDVLCNDLVTAYQELAVQMQNITHSAGYREAVGEELDLEAVLRKTLEFVIKQAGPSNAAVFLPSSADEFALGGYVNYDCTKESADMLLEHLADVLAPGVAESGEEILHATDNEALTAMLGDDWNYLADCHLLAMPVCHDGEALAVITLFRDNDQPYTEPAIEALGSIADQMGTLLAKIIRVHHRSMPGFDDPAFDDAGYDPTQASDTYLPPEEWDGYDQQADPFDEEDEDDLPF